MSRRPPDEAGFVLPLALAGVLLLGLSSLSLQAAVLHGRRLAHLEQQGLQQRDQLASAAQWARYAAPSSTAPVTAGDAGRHAAAVVGLLETSVDAPDRRKAWWLPRTLVRR